MRDVFNWNSLAILIAGACVGWLESSRSTEEINRILEIAFTIIAGTVVLGASVKFQSSTEKNTWIQKFIEAEKSAWPIAIFLLGFTLTPLIICLIFTCSECIPCEPCP